MYEQFASGGMATVHLGRLLGPVGFSRHVAIKQLHANYAADPEFASMFVDEARLAGRIRHPNVVQALDVVTSQGELFVVLDYVHGESLARLTAATTARGETVAPAIAGAILFGVLEGLHAAHEARDEQGRPLDLVHRDVSPQNVLVGSDGVARVLDFGVAKARGRLQITRPGEVKGKLGYMAPEQLKGAATRQTDIFAAAVVLWEALAGKRIFAGESEAETLAKMIAVDVVSPRIHAPAVPPALEEVVMKGLARDPASRFATAREMALALRSSVAIASSIEVGAWVERLAHEELDVRAARIATIEASARELHEGGDASPPRALLQPPANAAASPARASLPTAPVLGLAEPSAEPDLPRREHGDARAAGAPPRGSAASGRNGRAGVVAGLAVAALAIVAAASAAMRPTAKTSPDAPPRDVAAAAAPILAASEAPEGVALAASREAPAALPKPAPAAPRAAPAHRGPAARASCTPPYTTDAMGFHHYKPECLK